MGVENPVLKGTKCKCGFGMDTLTAENGKVTYWCSICNRVKPVIKEDKPCGIIF
jgi:hypothetical protein